MQPVVIKRDRVSLTEPTLAPRAIHRHTEASSGEPVGPAVRAVEHDGRIVALEVTCACGDVALVELRYPGGAPTNSPHKP